ncbi:hypothetical protein F5J12DRAFT_787575 [Pisolithus orientalis]|uniref:uncharacterized protein n=1 Tax=Pisolithus orientalis TaxID=936130 RepID=UPI002224C9D6|nr:uncharacterized protein F5J12DRAFT_787575 [Pisolithus orientalis]KAI5984394.1 hypothetical protein F5J12DRAFT_787575 [Pisolithus orientalis]
MDELQDIWHGISYLVLDEVLMVSAELLSDVASRISLAKARDLTKKDLPFGGVNVIFTGNMAQFHALNGTALYSHAVVNNLTRCTFEMVKSQWQLFGAFLWRSLTHVIQLIQNEQAQVDPMFIKMLACIRLGPADTSSISQPSDLHYLQQRLLTELHKNDKHEFQQFAEAPIQSFLQSSTCVIIGMKKWRSFLLVVLVNHLNIVMPNISVMENA